MAARRRLLLASALLLLAPGETRAADKPPLVLAAASLTDALRDAVALWQASGHLPPLLSFGASSTMARQIEQGAPAAVFASADLRWMDYLETRGLIVPGTRRNLLRNRLVLVVPKDQARNMPIDRESDLAGMLGAQGRLAIGDPAHVPAGLYAEQALRTLGLWPSVQDRLARAADVRAALLLVERGEAAAGIVYATDAAASARVSVAGAFPADSHAAVVYPVALVRGGDTPAARAFFAFQTGPEARAAFLKRGFGVE